MISNAQLRWAAVAGLAMFLVLGCKTKKKKVTVPKKVVLAKKHLILTEKLCQSVKNAAKRCNRLGLLADAEKACDQWKGRRIEEADLFARWTGAKCDGLRKGYDKHRRSLWDLYDKRLRSDFEKRKKIKLPDEPLIMPDAEVPDDPPLK